MMTQQPLTAAKLLLLKHEGLRLKPYRDTVGKLTIGVGRNLDDKGISEAEAMHLLANDIVATSRELMDKLPLYNHLDDVRKLALLDMGFMGVDKLLQFTRMLDAIKHKDWTQAAIHCLDSLWARQVHTRSADVANMLQTGELPDDIKANLGRAV